MAEVAIAKNQSGLHSCHEGQRYRGEPSTRFFGNFAAEIAIMVPPHPNGVGLHQKGGDLGGAVGASKGIDGVTNGDNLIDVVLAKESQGTSQLGRMAVDISNDPQTHGSPPSSNS
jgi:hypothetical protein